MSERVIALVGNPNSGKTTVFNGLTGGRVKTGNWPGVTVEKKEGVASFNDTKVKVIDLPGIYSLAAHSDDEKIARDFILSKEASLIVNIVDASNLERNLYLTTQLIEMKVPTVVVVNMQDIAEKRNIKIDLKKLSRELTVPVVGISAVVKKDIHFLKDQIDKILLSELVVPSVDIKYPNEIEGMVNHLQEKVHETARLLGVDSRWIAVKILENDVWVKNNVYANDSLAELDIELMQNNVEKILKDSTDIVCADYKYGFIHGVCQQAVKKVSSRRTITDKVDKFILNRILGIPIFLAVMYIIFWLTINVGGAFIDFFDISFGAIFVDGFGEFLSAIGCPEWLRVFLADGVGGGIQTVATFIPVIVMMFFLLSLLEDSGYMARAAFIMDKFMRGVGLPGKSFVPMLVGFGCTVPAVMATRTLENKKDRFLTIFMTPFMSCGARLPVYALFVAAFFPKSGGTVVFLIYIIGILFAILTGLLLKKTLFRGDPSYFVMELPPYHRPRLKHILIHTWERLKGFILRAGKVIVIVVIVLTFLNSLGIDGSLGNEDGKKSVLSKIGMSITPVFEPMGIEKKNWPATVGLFTGIFAKEAVVGTLNSLYAQIDEEEKSSEEEKEGKFSFSKEIKSAFVSIPENLSDIFGSFTDPLGVGLLEEQDQGALAEEIGAEKAIFAKIGKFFPAGQHQVFAYLLFILLYFPCVAALGAVIKEAGGILGTINAVYLTLLAWITSTLYYQISVAHNLFWIVFPIILLIVMIGGLYYLGKRIGVSAEEES